MEEVEDFSADEAVNTEEYNPFWHGGAAALLMSGIIVAFYLFVCQPARENASVMNQRLINVRQRITEQKSAIVNINTKCDEIERGDPETLRELIRQELLKGESGELIF